MGKKRGGLFKPPKHRWLAEIVTYESTRDARRAARKLVNAIKTGRLGSLRIGEVRARQIILSLNLAANRAEASAKRKNISRKEKKKLKEIAEIYRRAQRQASLIYRKKFGR